MKRVLKLLIGLLIFLLFFSFSILAASTEDPIVEIGNITRIKGARENQLFGYGLVMGLSGSGDSNRYQPTIESHANMLSNMGINVTADQIRSRNVASVMVTATLG